MKPGNNIEALKSVFPKLSLGKESETEFILIQDLILPEGCSPGTVDALLCPTERDGYPSRLFLSSQVAHGGLGTNWNACGIRILDRSWWAVSWRVNPSDSFLELVQNHLRAFKK